MAVTHLRDTKAESSHQVLEIDIDAILKFQEEDDEGFTTLEWSEKLGISHRRMQVALKKGLQEGLFLMGDAGRKTFDGRNYRAKVFRYVG